MRRLPIAAISGPGSEVKHHDPDQNIVDPFDSTVKKENVTPVGERLELPRKMFHQELSRHLLKTRNIPRVYAWIKGLTNPKKTIIYEPAAEVRS